MLRRELAERRVERDAARAGVAFQILPERAVTRLGPRLDGAVIERFAAVGDHQVEVEVNRIAEALAARARPVGAVEGEQARLRLLVNAAAALALEALVDLLYVPAAT